MLCEEKTYAYIPVTFAVVLGNILGSCDQTNMAPQAHGSRVWETSRSTQNFKSKQAKGTANILQQNTAPNIFHQLRDRRGHCTL